MKRVWKFISRPQNLAVLVALGGVIAFGWTQVISPRLSTSPPQAGQQQSTATHGTAINASGTAQVSIGRPLTELPSGSAAPCPSKDTGQSVQANEGGIAVNANCSSRVEVNSTR